MPLFQDLDRQASLTKPLLEAALMVNDIKGPDFSPHILCYAPRVIANPYQSMLYSRAYDHGFAPIALKSGLQLFERPHNLNVSMHYHWINGVFARAKTAKQAEAHMHQFIDHVDIQKQAGIRVIWTIHNILSHEARFPELEMHLRQKMAQLADILHIMNPETVELVAPYYKLPLDKIMSVPHASYKGVYGDYISQTQARADLGLNAHDKVMLLFGGLGVHKGVLRFLDQLDAIQSRLDGPVKLLLAGKITNSSLQNSLYKSISKRSDIVLFEGHHGDHALETCFKACDVVVCPYPRALNSGVAMTAISFGRPVIIPQSLMSIFNDLPEAAYGFQPSAMQEIPAVIQQAIDCSGTLDFKAALLRWSDDRHPSKISDQFFAALNDQ